MQVLTTSFIEILCSVYVTELNSYLLITFSNAYQSCGARYHKERGRPVASYEDTEVQIFHV